MPIPGYIEYQRREYCRSTQCPVQALLDRQTPGSAEYEAVRALCKAHCIRSTYAFHHWLIEQGYAIVRPAP